MDSNTSSTSAYLSNNLMIWSIVTLVLGIILFLFGGIILAKGLKCIRFTRGVSGLWFFGYLTYLLGIVIIVNVSPSDPTTALWIVFGCTIGFAILGDILCSTISILGDIVLGAASGWSLWTIFSPFVSNNIINLVVSIVLALVFAILVVWFKEKAQIFASSWIGSILLISGAVYIIINSIVLSGDYDALVSGSLILYIISIIATFLAFGIASYLHFRSNSSIQQPIEKQEDA